MPEGMPWSMHVALKDATPDEYNQALARFRASFTKGTEPPMRSDGGLAGTPATAAWKAAEAEKTAAAAVLSAAAAVASSTAAVAAAAVVDEEGRAAQRAVRMMGITR
jgi:hypothetical protein